MGPSPEALNPDQMLEEGTDGGWSLEIPGVGCTGGSAICSPLLQRPRGAQQYWHTVPSSWDCHSALGTQGLLLHQGTRTRLLGSPGLP